MMFRGDFIVWSLVEFFWMSVNLLLISVIYNHTSSIAGWSKYEMMLLVGTSMLIQRFLMGFFWSSIFEMGRNVRTGNFDFFLAQPGNVMFMATTRKLDLDGLLNSLVAASVVVYAAHQLQLQPTALDITLYIVSVLCGLVIHYSILVLSISAVFWLTSAQGVEGGYFTLTEFSRLPREAFKGVTNILFVWLLPVVVVSNAPAQILLHGFSPKWLLWLVALAVGWFALAVFVFHRGLRRYASASS
jgi:ABC-2 type transport system permease protein